MRPQTLLPLLLFASGPLLADHAGSPHKSLVNLNKDGVAIESYDPVAHFPESKPVKGDPKYKAQHTTAVYCFATAEHQAQFEAMPAVTGRTLSPRKPARKRSSTRATALPD